jgi:hypothetical protein
VCTCADVRTNIEDCFDRTIAFFDDKNFFTTDDVGFLLQPINQTTIQPPIQDMRLQSGCTFVPHNSTHDLENFHTVCSNSPASRINCVFHTAEEQCIKSNYAKLHERAHVHDAFDVGVHASLLHGRLFCPHTHEKIVISVHDSKCAHFCFCPSHVLGDYNCDGELTQDDVHAGGMDIFA